MLDWLEEEVELSGSLILAGTVYQNHNLKPRSTKLTSPGFTSSNDNYLQILEWWRACCLRPFGLG